MADGAFEVYDWLICLESPETASTFGWLFLSVFRFNFFLARRELYMLLRLLLKLVVKLWWPLGRAVGSTTADGRVFWGKSCESSTEVNGLGWHSWGLGVAARLNGARTSAPASASAWTPTGFSPKSREKDGRIRAGAMGLCPAVSCASLTGEVWLSSDGCCSFIGVV